MSFESPNEIPQWFADRRAECRLESVECRQGRRVAGVGHGKPPGASVIRATKRLRPSLWDEQKMKDESVSLGVRDSAMVRLSTSTCNE